MSKAQIQRLFINERIDYDHAKMFLKALGLDDHQAREILRNIEMMLA